MTAKLQKRQNDRNMTEGVIWKELTAFAVHLLGRQSVSAAL